MKNFWVKVLGVIAGLLVLGLVAALVFRAGWVTFIDNYELGYAFDKTTGEIEVLKETGYVIRSPLVEVDTVDLRPMQLCMNANTRVLNCKLVKFNPDGLKTLIAWHGRGNYEGNKSSSNSSNSNKGSSSEDDTRFEQIMKSYAFQPEGKLVPPFLTILQW